MCDEAARAPIGELCGDRRGVFAGRRVHAAFFWAQECFAFGIGDEKDAGQAPAAYCKDPMQPEWFWHVTLNTGHIFRCAMRRFKNERS